MGKLLNLGSVMSPSLLFHGGFGLVHVRCHARAPAKPHKSGVYDSGEVSYLSSAQRSCIPYSGGGYIFSERCLEGGE
jgi:hypothetical protein